MNLYAFITDCNFKLDCLVKESIDPKGMTSFLIKVIDCCSSRQLVSFLSHYSVQ